VNPQNGLLEKWLPLVAPLLVLPPWIWLAVRTQHCLQVITVHSIPFPKRTIWLVKTLALIVAVGGNFWSRGPSWDAMVSRYFTGRDSLIFRAQKERAGRGATQAEPRRGSIPIIMANVSQPAWRFHALVEVVRRFIPNAYFDRGFRGQNAEDCSDWSLRFLPCRGSFLNWCDELQAIEVASLALSTLWMCFPWFLG
jgi:hypothetical protein